MMIKQNLFKIENNYHSFLKQLASMLYEMRITPARQRVHASSKSSKDDNKAFSAPSPLLGYIETYIEAHLDEPLKLEKLAEEAGMSKYQLIRRFKTEKNITPWQYLIKKRLERVKQLLENGMPPGQVALETGFYDQSHMHHAFCEETGQTPKEYQQKNFKNRN